MLQSLIRLKPRPHMSRFENFFGRGESESHRVAARKRGCAPLTPACMAAQRPGFLNRASWLRQDGDYLTKACKSDEARFVILDGTSNPLVRKEDRSKGVKDVVKEKLEGGLGVAVVRTHCEKPI